MSNDHSHDHEHGHHHNHQHEHTHGEAGEMPLVDKLEKLVTHWIKHNRDHVGTYRQWAEKAREGQMAKVADLIESVADSSDEINRILEAAQAQVAEEKKAGGK